jgi:uncharacterized membrane protein
MKRFSMSSVIIEMEIKISMSYPFTVTRIKWIRIRAGEDMEKLKSS